MPALTITPLPQLRDNYAYVVVCPRTRQAAVVDPADAESVLAEVERQGARLVAIWNTHHHWDHTGGNQALLQRLPELEVVGHASDAGRVPGLTRPVQHGDFVPLGDAGVRVLHNPGHTSGAVSFVVDAAGHDDVAAVFTGDTLFGAGCGRLFEGTPAQMAHSLRQVLGTLPSATQVYFGHEYTEGNLRFAREVDPDNPAIAQRAERVAALRAAGRPSVPSTLAEEWATNPFLRTDTEGVLATACAHVSSDAALDGADPAAVLAVIRKLKDDFRG